MDINNEFINLVKENPELKVVFFVGTEVVADDSFGSWYAEIASCGLDEIYKQEFDTKIRFGDEERIYIKSEHEDDLVDYIADVDLNTEEYEELNEDEKYDKAKVIFNEVIPWEKVILVYINN